jgi:hypothetical protein
VAAFSTQHEAMPSLIMQKLVRCDGSAGFHAVVEGLVAAERTYGVTEQREAVVELTVEPGPDQPDHAPQGLGAVDDRGHGLAGDLVVVVPRDPLEGRERLTGLVLGEHLGDQSDERGVVGVRGLVASDGVAGDAPRRLVAGDALAVAGVSGRLDEVHGDLSEEEGEGREALRRTRRAWGARRVGQG